MALRCIEKQKRFSLYYCLNWMELLRYHELATAEISVIFDYITVVFKLTETKSLKNNITKLN